MEASMEFGVPWPALNDGLDYSEVARCGASSPAAEPELLTVVDYYASKYQRSASREGWTKRIARGQIEVDGETVRNPDFLVRNGARLIYCRLPWEEPHAPYLLQILYEDEHLLALNKPSGLQVLPAGLFQQRTVLTQLAWRAKASGSFPGQHPTPVHRLGRGTSGVLLCAKSSEARVALALKLAAGTRAGSAGESRSLSKVYRALVTGVLKEDEVAIDQPIGKAHYPGVRGGLYMAVSQGKPSFSKVRVVECNKQHNTTIVEVEIYSGRPHQIRIHLASIGHPLLGDPLYVAGGQPSGAAIQNAANEESVAEDGGYERPVQALPGDCGYHLHAHKLSFDHPVTGEKMEIEAPLSSMLSSTRHVLNLG